MKQLNDMDTLRRSLESAYEPTPDAFHRRVQDTLADIRRENMKEEPVVKKKIGWGAVLLAALVLIGAIGVAATVSHALDYITGTMAKNWVLEEANAMLHENAAQAALGDCTATLAEWISDGRQLYVAVSVIDPALATEGHFVPEDPEEEYLGGLNHYTSLYDGTGDLRLSAGEAKLSSYRYEWGDEAGNEILYTYEFTLENVGEAFTAAFPVVCSAGRMELTFDVTAEDFGLARDFAPSARVETDEYTAQVTAFHTTALRTYVETTLTFDEGVPEDRRRQIASSYQAGLMVPEGQLNVEAGSGEDIAIAHVCRWAEDGLSCVIQMEGNPRETFPQTVLYCPRWGWENYDWEGLCPLSLDGAIAMEMTIAK